MRTGKGFQAASRFAVILALMVMVMGAFLQVGSTAKCCRATSCWHAGQRGTGPRLLRIDGRKDLDRRNTH